MKAPCGSSLPLSSCRKVLRQMGTGVSSLQMTRAPCGDCSRRRSQQRCLQGNCSSRAPGRASLAGKCSIQTSFWGIPAHPGCRSLSQAGATAALWWTHTVPATVPPCAHPFRLAMLARLLQLLSRSKRLPRAGQAACSGPGQIRGRQLTLILPPGLLRCQEMVSCSRALTGSG